jgi:hypothetical protein
MNPRVLCSKVNPRISTHRLAIDEADAIIGVTGNPLILQAMAASHGYALVPLDAGKQEGNTLDLVLGESESHGAFAAEVRAALSDGMITENEYKRIGAAAFAVNDATLALLGALRRATGTRHPNMA